MQTIAAVFHNEVDARQAYARLQESGVGGDQIGIVMRDDASERGRRVEQVHDADEWLGAGVGTVIGGTAGWVAGIGAAGAALAIPVVGPVLAAGALAGIISAAGGTLGWLAGGLVARGIEGNEAKFYQSAVEEGNVLVTVHTTETNAERVRSILRMSNGREYRAG
jgi:hypothetical protein